MTNAGRKASREGDKECAIRDCTARLGLSGKVTFEQRPGNLCLPLQKRALRSEEGRMEGVLLLRKQFQFLAALPNLGLIMFALQALCRASCLAPPPSPRPAASCATRHLVATAVLTIILPQRSQKFSENGHLSMPERGGRASGHQAEMSQGCHSGASCGAAQPGEASDLRGGGRAPPV